MSKLINVITIYLHSECTIWVVFSVCTFFCVYYIHGIFGYICGLTVRVSNVVSSSSGAWLPAALLAIPDLIFARTQEGGEGATLCQRFYPAGNAPLWVAVFHLQLVFVGLVIPGLVLLVCYCVIVTRLTRGPLGGQRQKRRAVRTTIALVLCFFVCWLPYGAGISVDALLRLEVLPRTCSLEAVLGVWLAVAEPMAFAHCCLNPLLYAFLGAGFKSSARRALTLSRASSLRILPRRKAGASTTTESESSSLHSS